jgi:hypothetical protein
MESATGYRGTGAAVDCRPAPEGGAVKHLAALLQRAELKSQNSEKNFVLTPNCVGLFSRLFRLYVGGA